ncbi:MAG: CRISPR-associated endoribonuclease Cas6 [Methanophagales archaeon]|nr:CRISPR-associated endoribonuclease Cas6 [Methanophagales archaeon]MCW7073965.1 CRISPR-associated endoribonuclease Cas6 [Methanophagales archaeon]
MRLIIKIEPSEDFSADVVYKHTIQGFIYECLRDVDEDANFHSAKRFKFFCFSDMFPGGDFVEGEAKRFIVSSPNAGLMERLFEGVRAKKDAHIGAHKVRIEEVKKVKVPLKNQFISGSPIVLYKDSRRNLYYSFRRDGDLDFFLARLKDNAVKKYEAFYGEKLTIEDEEPLFDRLRFNKEVAVKNVKGGKEFIIIGSVWYLLEKFEISEEMRRFYWFLMECGLGEKNSMGFGFVNPVR